MDIITQMVEGECIEIIEEEDKKVQAKLHRIV